MWVEKEGAYGNAERRCQFFRQQVKAPGESKSDVWQVVEFSKYFKTDEVNRGEYEAAGAGPFVPFADKPHTMPYHEVPADVMEDAEELRAWAQRAWQAGRRAGTRKTPAKR